jgi:hypothetical protein
MTGDTPDPITVLRMKLASDPPARTRFYLAPRSLAARLAAGAEHSGDEVTDLGPGALLYTQAAKPAEFHRDGQRFLVLVGVAEGRPVGAVGAPGARRAGPRHAGGYCRPQLIVTLTGDGSASY